MTTVEPTQTILIVEDDPQTSDLVARVLSTENRVLLTVSTVAQARDLLQNQTIDLLLLDLYLPDGTGINLLSELDEKNGNRSQRPPVIIMTAFGSWETHVKAYNLGAYYYLDKPFKITQLRTLVEQALAGTVK